MKNMANSLASQERTPPPALAKMGRYGLDNPLIAAAGVVLLAIVLMALLAPVLTSHDPQQLDPLMRLKSGDAEHLLGTDSLGRDVLSRVMHGARISLAVGVGAAMLSVGIGLLLGLVAGYVRSLDAIMMRIVDGMMAIPNVLLAVSIVSLVGASLWTVLIAITVPEVPRVVRLVRSIVLTAREEPYVEAARTLGSSTWKILWRHLMPNTVAPLIVQGSYICASAILTESILSFLGAGISPAIPTWGNIMADGRSFFRLMPELIFWPGLCVSGTILAINLIGDAARDLLDPRLAKRGASR
jgi:peptide/nickel transport system permease protein